MSIIDLENGFRKPLVVYHVAKYLSMDDLIEFVEDCPTLSLTPSPLSTFKKVMSRIFLYSRTELFIQARPEICPDLKSLYYLF